MAKLDGLQQAVAGGKDKGTVHFLVNDVQVVSVNGGTPMPATAERYTNEFFSQVSPDGRTLAFSARHCVRSVVAQRPQPHRRVGDLGQVAQLGQVGQAGGEYRRIVEIGAKAPWPMWSDESTLFYMSDRSGSENIWKIGLASGAAQGQSKPVTAFTRGRVLLGPA